MDLQSTILMNHVWVAILNAGLTVFEPAQKQQTRQLFFDIMICLSSQVLIW